jgi:hypothetical protein
LRKIARKRRGEKEKRGEKRGRPMSADPLDGMIEIGMAVKAAPRAKRRRGKGRVSN